MNKLIFRKLFLDILYFFLLSSLAITLIVWVIQGVNFLDIIAEQGHAIKIYLIYSLLNIPKIFSKLLIFTFFLTLFVVISRYEDNNEIIVFWTNGIKKISFINFIGKMSILFLGVQLFLNLLIVPYTQNLGQEYLRNSSKELLPNLSDEIKMINELINYENTINTKTNLFNSNNYIVNSIKNEIIKQLSLINNKHIKINDQIIEIKDCTQPIFCTEDNNEYDDRCKIYPENYKYCYETYYYYEKAKIILKLFDLITSQNYISKNNNIQILPESQNESKSLIIKKLNNIINFENENKTVELIINNLKYILDGLNGIKIKINYNDKIIIFSRLYDDNYQEDFELNFEDEKNIIVQLSKLLNPSFDIL